MVSMAISLIMVHVTDCIARAQCLLPVSKLVKKTSAVHIYKR